MLPLFVAASLVAPGGIFSSLISPFIGSIIPETSAVGEIALADETSSNSQNARILSAALNVDPNPSKGGGDIIIVGGSALLSENGPDGTLANIDDQSKPDTISLYNVREGDTLSQIAEMFGVSVNTIIWANDLKRGTLVVPGQLLVILPITGIKHTVADGDTLSKIAEKYDGDLDEIASYNGFDVGASLDVGTEIIIPDGTINTPVYTTAYASSPESGPAPSYDDYFILPTQGVRTQGLHGYNGVDIGAACGTPIVASASGSVIISKNGGWNGGYGNYSVIKHQNGTQTLYAHTSSNFVYIGQSVVQGQVIGYIGSTGRSTGCHVHFEVRGAVNPFGY